MLMFNSRLTVDPSKIDINEWSKEPSLGPQTGIFTLTGVSIRSFINTAFIIFIGKLL